MFESCKLIFLIVKKLISRLLLGMKLRGNGSLKRSCRLLSRSLINLVQGCDSSMSIIQFQADDRLANGSSIHTMSALLLQLLQASAYGAVARVRALRSSVLEAEVMGVEGEEKLDIAREVSLTLGAALITGSESLLGRYRLGV